MRPQIQTLLGGIALFLTIPRCQAANKWPKTIVTTNRVVIRIYKPEIINYSDSTVESRSVISVMDWAGDDPIFGTMWSTAKVSWDTAQKLARIRSLHVDNMILPDDSSPDDIRYLSGVIEFRMPLIMSYTPIRRRKAPAERQQPTAEPDQAAADPYTESDKSAPPVIYYRNQPTALVLIDGAPRLQRNEQWGLDVVENSAFVIVKDRDEKYYLYGGGHWYMAPAATGPYAYTHDRVSRTLRKIARGFEKAARKDGVDLPNGKDAPVYAIIVSTVPAILIQSNGDPQPERIPGTSLVYVQNSPNDVFFDTATYVYYVDAGGEWYRSDALKDSGNWRPVPPQALPADFSKIPPQSVKGQVLSNVPGTAAAAAMQREQYVPTVQKIDRGATTSVEYDGAPQFSPIEGTRLQYATNTCAIVLLEDGLYYTVDDGFWFVANGPQGDWLVSNRRPAGLDLIPRGHPAYRSRFVYIYRTTHDFVWDGYLPGYLDDPSGGCGIAESQDYDLPDDAWCFDLDFVFGWGGGWYDGYYWLDRHHRYYGGAGFGGKWAHWRYRHGHGARKWNGGSWARRGQFRPRSTRGPGSIAHEMPRRVNTMTMPVVVTFKNIFGSGSRAYTSGGARGGYTGRGFRGGGGSHSSGGGSRSGGFRSGGGSGGFRSSSGGVRSGGGSHSGGGGGAHSSGGGGGSHGSSGGHH